MNIRQASKLKQQVHLECCTWLSERIEGLQEAITSAREAAFSEDKSSAGDKYETGRAMMHLEQEKNHAQLSYLLDLKKVLDQIDPRRQQESVAPGSLVVTDHGCFYIAIPAGDLKISDQQIIAISPVSPLARHMQKAGKGGLAKLPKAQYRILQIF